MLWAITCFFNPAHYTSLLNNYFIFRDQLERQKVPLLTVELAFNNDQYDLPALPNVLRLRSHSIMWQKERLLNYALKNLPAACDSFAWIDCDLLFSHDDWAALAEKELEQSSVIQLFDRGFYLKRGETAARGKSTYNVQSIFAQFCQNGPHDNWMRLRHEKKIPFATPGFAWAARRSLFDEVGLYDRCIVGGGDIYMVNSFLNSWTIHDKSLRANLALDNDLSAWYSSLQQAVVPGYLPIKVYHLWHGDLKNRAYLDRYKALMDNDFDPQKDIMLMNNVFEWATHKPDMHTRVADYFYGRNEDGNAESVGGILPA